MKLLKGEGCILDKRLMVSEGSFHACLTMYMWSNKVVIGISGR